MDKSGSFIPGKAGNLYIYDSGRGDLPLLFVPGLAGTIDQWSFQLGYFGRARRVIAVDPRGHGKSEASKTENYSLRDFASDIEAVLDFLKIDRVVLIGHSFGGSINLAFASQQPSRIAGLLLLDPNWDVRKLPQEQFRAYLAGMHTEAYEKNITNHFESILKGASQTVHDQVMRDLRNTSKGTVVGALEASVEFDPISALESYNGPMCSIITELNESPFALHQLWPILTSKKVEGVSHWLQMDKPKEVNRLIEKFCERLA